MIELYRNINEEVRKDAEVIWKMALSFKDPKESAKYLNDSVALYRNTHTEEEVDFLDFYFQMQMEMMKNETDNNSER